jgi:hypothetical protein
MPAIELKTSVFLLLAVALVACERSSLGKNNDDTLVLVAQSLMGSTLMLASFDGNGGAKDLDCEQTRDALKASYPSREYKCDRFAAVKRQIQKEEEK